MDNAFKLLSQWCDVPTVVVGLVIQDKRGRVAIQLRDDFPTVNAHGRWGMFGGHHEADETIAQTAIRELEEETSIRITEDEIVPFVRFIPPKGYQARHYFFHLRRSIEPHEISIREGAGFAFISASQMDKFDMLESNNIVFEHLCALNKIAV